MKLHGQCVLLYIREIDERESQVEHSEKKLLNISIAKAQSSHLTLRCNATW